MAEKIEARIHNVLDNRLAQNILRGLSSRQLELHQVVPLHSSTESNSSIGVHKADLVPKSLHSLLQTIHPDLIFSTSSAGSYDFQKQLIDIAISTKVARFVPAEFFHDSLNDLVQARLPPCREKARVIQYLREQADQHRISWSAVATGITLDHALSSGELGFDLKWQSATIYGTGNERFAASSSSWIGKVAAVMVDRWETVRERYLYVTGMVVSAREITTSLEESMGVRWEAGCTDTEDCVKEAERRIERGFPDAGMFLMERSVLYDAKLCAVQPFLSEDGKAMLWLEGEDLDAVIHEVVHNFTHQNQHDCGCA